MSVFYINVAALLTATVGWVVYADRKGRSALYKYGGALFVAVVYTVMVGQIRQVVSGSGAPQEVKALPAVSGASVQSAQPQAETLSPAKAKALALAMEKTMGDVEQIVMVPRAIQDDDLYWKRFYRPLAAALNTWPTPWYEPKNSAIEPYQVCAEAALAIQAWGEMRHDGNIDERYAEQRRSEYMEKRPRCTAAVNVAVGA
ncbi:hypothetical protein [Methylogaea oryzae]|uniref:Uncharacterized protein n=1 Tax=Methylogaea oryzae TaxID=1295382 RepID=A0A8D4VNC1_9GAMM|nr:hypothetical protein [Methylogaea oryzae]BBL69709.1 hypothetical protein MoryE10_03150 [Methylogaea oryzae]